MNIPFFVLGVLASLLGGSFIVWPEPLGQFFLRANRHLPRVLWFDIDLMPLRAHGGMLLIVGVTALLYSIRF